MNSGKTILTAIAIQILDWFADAVRASQEEEGRRP